LKRAACARAQDGAPPVRVVIYCHGNACDIGEVYLNLKQCVAALAYFCFRCSPHGNEP
jgi:hypothetical protein